MVAYHYFSLDKNGQIHGYGWNFNMADIEYHGFSSYLLTYTYITIQIALFFIKT